MLVDMRRAMGVFGVLGVLGVLVAFGWQQSQLEELRGRVEVQEADDSASDLEWDLDRLRADVEALDASVARVEDHEAAIGQVINDLYRLDRRIDDVESYAMSAEEMAYRLARIIGAR